MGSKELVLGSCIWFLILLILAIPLLILFIWKGTVILVAKCIRRDLRVLEPMDTIVSPGGFDKSVVNFGLVLTVQGEVALEDLQLRFTEKFLRTRSEVDSSKYQYEKFHSCLVSFGGFLFAKVLPRLDINDHIYIKRLGEGQILEDLLSEWVLTRYKADTPFWEVILVPPPPSSSAGDETVVAFKIHHAFADGYSVLYILDELTGGTSPYLVKDFQETLGQKVSQMVQVPCYVDKVFPTVQSPFKCAQEDTYRWWMVFTRLDLNLLKKIRRQHDVNFSVLILSLIAGVLRKYLLETRSLDELPSVLEMATTLAWPNHPARNPSTPSSDRMCNHWITGTVSVPMNGDNPLERLLGAEKNFQEFTDLGLSKSLKRTLLPFLWLLPASVIGKSFSKDPGFTGGYSTILGGDDYKLLGKSITQIHPVLAIHDSNPFIPVSAFTFSHSNHLELTLSVNPQHFPNREVLNRLVKEELPHELKRLSILSGIVDS